MGDYIAIDYKAVALVQETRAITAEARIAELETALRDAIESVESWAGYADEYFKEKHDLAGQLAQLRSVFL